MFLWGTSCNMVCIWLHMYAYWYCLFTSIVQMYCNCVFSKSLLYTLTSCLHTPFIHLISYMSEYMHYCMCMFMVCFPPDLESFCFCLSLDVSSMGKWRRTMDETWSLLNIAMVEVVYICLQCHDAQRWCLKETVTVKKTWNSVNFNSVWMSWYTIR